jgi:hypothetical protein
MEKWRPYDPYKQHGGGRPEWLDRSQKIEHKGEKSLKMTSQIKHYQLRKKWLGSEKKKN